MLKIQNILRSAALLLLVAYPIIGHTLESSSPRTLTVTIKSPRPVPPDLVPLIYHGNLGGEIRRFMMYGNQSVIEMKPTATSTYTAEIPWNQSTVALAVDHPGYLRGYSTMLSLSGSTTHTIKLPVPGSLHAKLDLQYIRAGHRPHYADAKGHCITSTLTRQTTSTYQIENPVLPITAWELSYDDLAPGNYEIFATGRDCYYEREEHPGRGPARTAGNTYFTVKSGHLTELGFPIFTRGGFDKSETVSPTISIIPLSTSIQK